MDQSFPQDNIHSKSLSNPTKFWDTEARKLIWAKQPSSVLETISTPGSRNWRWFPEGEISTTYNCLTRHVEAGYGDQTAIIWDSPVTDTYNYRISYAQLLKDVQVLAGVLRGMGVEKGSRVLIYMPMIPSALTAMCATAHLGAVHSVVFGGFAPAECAKRIASCHPKVIVTASCGIEGGKGRRKIIPYVPLLREAIRLSGVKGLQLLVRQRQQHREALESGERDWSLMVDMVQQRWRPVPEKPPNHQHDKEDDTTETQMLQNPEALWAPVMDGVPVGSNDPLYIIYTSGTTGLPKGVVREAAGHAVGLNMQIGYLFGINAGDVIFTASDIGWVVGHSYIVYAPLLCRATTVLFEGKPVGTPSAGTFWRIISDYRVNVLYTAPTALRAIRREDPSGDAFFKNYDLRCLRGLFLAGERSEPGIIEFYQKLLDQYCAPGARVVDNWWSTESGSPMTGIALGLKGRIIPLKPGSAGKPMPGWDIKVVDNYGKEVEQGETGNIVLGMPLCPTGFRTLWQDDSRFKTGYLSRFRGAWLDTGDAGMIDGEGYVHIMSRTDDIINVAAHRLSTGSIEEAIMSHPLVAECCVIGMPDALKGHVPFAFVHLNSATVAPTANVLFSEVNRLVREQIGPIASLGGLIEGDRIIPKTRSGKTLRRVVRELVEQACNGEFEKDVNIPPTIEDAEVVQRSKLAVRSYFLNKQKARL